MNKTSIHSVKLPHLYITSVGEDKFSKVKNKYFYTLATLTLKTLSSPTTNEMLMES